MGHSKCPLERASRESVKIRQFIHELYSLSKEQFIIKEVMEHCYVSEEIARAQLRKYERIRTARE
jgi:hypothetical protein